MPADKMHVHKPKLVHLFEMEIDLISFGYAPNNGQPNKYFVHYYLE